MTKEEIIKALRDMARYPTVTLPRDSEALKVAADLLAQPDPYAKGYADAMNWKVQNHIEHLPAAQPEQEPVCPDCKAKVLYECVACGSNNYPPKIEQEPVKIVAYNCTCGRTMKFESEHGVVAPQRTWVGLTDKEIDQGLLRTNYALKTAEAWRDGVGWAMTQLREKNAP